MNQTLVGHEGNVLIVEWNEKYKKLTTSDQHGLIIVWMLHKGMWFEEMINNRNKSVVRDLKWAKDGRKICIVYEDGAVIVGSVDGKRMWGRDLGLKPALVEWSPDGQTIIFCSVRGECHVYDEIGNHLSNISMLISDQSCQSSITGIDWHQSANHARSKLALGYENGSIQVMSDIGDRKPDLFQTGMSVSKIRWNVSGSILAVAGARANSAGRFISLVQFYNPHGHLLRTLRVPGNGINSIAWEGSSMRMALAVDSFIYFADIQPEYQWACIDDVIVYAFAMPRKDEICVTFWNSKSNERFAKYVRGLIGICAFGDYCALISEASMKNTFALIICDAKGTALIGKYMEEKPEFNVMTASQLITATDSCVYLWHYCSNEPNNAVTLQICRGNRCTQKTVKVGIHPGTKVPESDSSRFTLRDSICSLAASENMLLVGMQSGAVRRYSLRSLRHEATYNLESRACNIYLNCNDTKFSVIDIDGLMTVLDLNSASFHLSDPLHNQQLVTVNRRKDCRGMHWSRDMPDLYVTMEKNRMYVFRNGDPEEPVLSSGHVYDFSDLEIKAILLEEIMQTPQTPRKEHVVHFETKALRDTRSMILHNISFQDLWRFVQKNGHQRLWQLLAHGALQKLDLAIAKQSFANFADIYGVYFVRKLEMICDEIQQRAEVSAFFQHFDNAEELFASMNRVDLSLAMRIKMGDWFHVGKIIRVGADDDWIRDFMFNNMGEYFFERQKWDRAASYFTQSKNVEKLVVCSYLQEEYDELEKIIHAAAGNHELLANIGSMFCSVGMCSQAVLAFRSTSDMNPGIEACVLLKRWGSAFSLVTQHNRQQITVVLQRYIGHLLHAEMKLCAINLYRETNDHENVVHLLSQLAMQSVTVKHSPMYMKKIYVLRALEESKINRSSARHFSTERGKEASAQMCYWRKAEAYHFLLLAHRQLYEGRFEYAKRTSLLLENYRDCVHFYRSQSLIALAAYYSGNYSVCGKACMKLQAEPGPIKGNISELTTEILSKRSLHASGNMRPPEERLVPWTSTKNASYLDLCFASGRSITAMDTVLRCVICMHKVIHGELRGSSTCPLCHSLL